MLNKLRAKVGGKYKNRLQEDGFDLDMTYITPRIIAMGFPASHMIQSLYRNRVSDVTQLLQKRHGNHFFIYNLSEQQYTDQQINLFEGRYYHIQNWVDHKAPQLIQLVRACQQIFQYLKENHENVVAIHCNAGKGRTGTLICCYLLYAGLADTAKDAINYYGWKRFKNGKGVTNPSQVRYCLYFEKILKEIIKIPQRLKLLKIQIENLPAIKRHFRIQTHIKSSQELFKSYQVPNFQQIKTAFVNDRIEIDLSENDVIVFGDFEIAFYHKSDKGKNDMYFAHAQLNTAFIHPFVSLIDNNQIQVQLPNQILDHHKNQKYLSSFDNFKVTLTFEKTCKTESCPSNLNINLQSQIQNFKEIYNVTNLCHYDIEYLEDEIQQWIEINNFTILRNSQGIGNFQFAVQHLFEQPIIGKMQNGKKNFLSKTDSDDRLNFKSQLSSQAEDQIKEKRKINSLSPQTRVQQNHYLPTIEIDNLAHNKITNGECDYHEIIQNEAYLENILELFQDITELGENLNYQQQIIPQQEEQKIHSE